MVARVLYDKGYEEVVEAAKIVKRTHPEVEVQLLGPVDEAYPNAVSREQIENYLFQLTHDLIMGVVLEQSKETALSDAQKNFIADFYKYSFVGIMLDWIRQGMKDDYTSICDNMCITIQGNITNSIKNFTNVSK